MRVYKLVKVPDSEQLDPQISLTKQPQRKECDVLMLLQSETRHEER